MKRTEFEALCGDLLIEPAIALENDHLRAALAQRRDDEVRRILAEEF